MIPRVDNYLFLLDLMTDKMTNWREKKRFK